MSKSRNSSCPDGSLLIDKPGGITSFDVIRKLKKNYQITRIGHTGTLDPMATGLLVILVGQATRLQDILMEGRKIYEGLIRLGIQTDTDDVTGEVIARNDGQEYLSPGYVELEEKLAKTFVGSQDQMPPQYSALKVDGERSYNIARKGETAALKSRPIEIFENKFKFIDDQTIQYRVVCSKGTYIRSIARDVGLLLGCGGTLQTIRRVDSAPFSVNEAMLLEGLDKKIEDNPSWLNLQNLVSHLQKVTVAQADVGRLSNGDQSVLSGLAISNIDSHNCYILVSEQGDVLGMAETVSEGLGQTKLKLRGLFNQG